MGMAFQLLWTSGNKALILLILETYAVELSGANKGEAYFQPNEYVAS